MSEEPASPATATGLYSHADFAVGAVLAGRFRIESMLGVGGMGVVYRATDLSLDVPVALKLLRPELANRRGAFERFRQELLLARQVSNPHVVRIHDLAQHEGRWLISMDYVDGEPLDRRLDRDGIFGIDEALQITRQLAEGLGAAHAKGVVHRDLKPANILLDRQGNAYIGDFGVARSLASSGLTQSGTVIGTPEYLSPEQARGGLVDARSDLYALGLILYEMLVGKPPFSGGTVAEILAQRLVRSPEPLSRHRRDAPAWVARLVDKLLRPQPAHRFRDAREVIAAIDQRAVARELQLRHHAWAAAIASLVLVAAGAGWWWYAHRQQVAPPVVVAESRPLHRMLVLPLAIADAQGRNDAALNLQLAATDVYLRDALAEMPGLAVVGGERTTQALRQLGGNLDNIGALRRTAAAERVLQPRLHLANHRWQVRAELHNDERAALRADGPVAPDALSAVRAWAQSPALMQALGRTGTAPQLHLPDAKALEAYGAGLMATQRGDLATALTQLQATTAAAPDDATAWLAQAEAAQAIGDQDAASTALERGQDAATRAAPGMHRRFVATRALLDGDAPTAIEQWRALLATTPDDAEAQLQLARAQGAGGDFTAAVAGLQALASRDAQDPRVWFELGKFSILSGAAQRAVDDDLVRALVLYKRSGNRFGEAETVNALGIGYGRLGQTADAIEQYRKAVELRGALGNRRGEATSLRNLGNVLTLGGQFDAAADSLAKARVLYAQLDDRAGLAAVENDLGLLAEERGDYPGALASFRRALQAWQHIDDPLGSAQALNDIGFAHYELGAYQDAGVYLQQAADQYAGLGDQTGMIRAEQDLGLLAIARGHWDEARRRLQHSLASAERQQMQEEASVSRRNLAELELQQGHLQAAIGQAATAQASFHQRLDPRGESDSGLLRADALLAAHADRDARQLLDSLEPATKASSLEQRAIAGLLRAELAQRDGDRPHAVEQLRKARQLGAASGIRQLQLRIDLASAQLENRLDPALDEATSALGHVGLRLQWLGIAMQDALAARDSRRATALYDEAATLLRSGDSLYAYPLHRLGAAARAAAGDPTGARLAGTRADAALATLRATVPANLRSSFDAAIPASRDTPGLASQ